MSYFYVACTVLLTVYGQLVIKVAGLVLVCAGSVIGSQG